MTRSEIARVAALYLVTLVAGTALWIALFHTPILRGAILFYRGLVLLAVTALVVAVVLTLLRRSSYRGLIGWRDIALIVTLLLSANALFFTHIPVTADRSISVFILGYMEHANGPLTQEQISDAVVDEFFLEQGALQKRLDEQLVTGTLVRTPEGYVLSDEGHWLIRFYELTARAFDLDTSNLAP